MKTADSRKAFLDFCETVSKMEGDKDKFLAAARLQRIERQPAFTGSQLVKLACLIAVAMIGSTGAVCMALRWRSGKWRTKGFIQRESAQ